MNTGNVQLLALESTAYSGAVEHTCYLRTRVLGSEDSLVSIKPENPTGYKSSLNAGDTCMVWDIFNRVYVFKLVEGPHTEVIPNVVSVTVSLYWELQKCFTAKNIRVEQFQISSIPLGSEYILTHANHNRDNSQAPVIQIYIDNKISTSAVRVYVLSSTQLKLVPTTGTLNNLTVNVVTAI
jgi:hypothetical protein